MGAETVDYHKDTVLSRADDHPGQALDYYASRGETPLRWGGAVARRLGLVGEVTPEQYDAAFGPGGFRDPLTGDRLVDTKTPGFEIVVAAHKATALLGVIGHAEDMHAILDIETQATMDRLEASMQETGGRRGRAATVTPTTGLIYATTRHGTSRAGDPSPHDHVLVANLTEMRDARGGFKALYSALLRDRVEAATMYGRLCSAWEAVRRGYAIELDNGPSGRLRHWRIRGIPQDACEQMSKRSDAIGEYLSEKGYVGYRATYQARSIAARASREVKRGTGVEELQPRWEAELAGIGWPIHRLAADLEAARAEHVWPVRRFTEPEIDMLARQLLDENGPFLARGKVFSRWRLMADVAPLLYGHDPAELDQVLDRILASPLVVPLIGVAGSREPVYTATEILETEHAIADCVERLTAMDGPQLHPERVLRAVADKQAEIGAELTNGQYAAINAVCGSGCAIHVVVGVAGSGKTTALDAAATALQDAGYSVIGTATSGQAARTLGGEAGIEARTMRSLLWHLDHGTIRLDNSSVVVLDEAGMTADTDMARLLLAVEAANAQVVIVGDDRQLSAVGPGGALHAVLDQRPDTVTVLSENLRQRDPAERDALLQLRDGNLDEALGFYATNDRIAVAADRTQTLVAMVDAWATDTQAGHDTLLLAWRRDSVSDLNRLARDAARRLGWLSGPDMQTPDGRLFAVGDLVVTLAPNYRGQLVTSQRAHVVAVDQQTQTLIIQTDRGRRVTLLGSELAADRIDHGYAITVHREQGGTCDRTHYYADGGGRELAYVACSRARGETTIHLEADNLGQAVERLRDDWARVQADSWLSPTTSVGHDPRHEPRSADPEADCARLRAELDATLALAPPDVTVDLDAVVSQLDDLETQRRHALAGTGPYQDTEMGRIARDLRDLDHDLAAAHAYHADARLWERRRWQRTIDTLENHQAARTEDWARIARPEVARIDRGISATEGRQAELERDDRFNKRWHAEHPEHAERVRQLEAVLHNLDRPTGIEASTPAPEPVDTADSLADDLLNAPYDREAAERVIERLDQIVEQPDPDPGLDPPSIADDLGIGL